MHECLHQFTKMLVTFQATLMIIMCHRIISSFSVDAILSDYSRCAFCACIDLIADVRFLMNVKISIKTCIISIFIDFFLFNCNWIGLNMCNCAVFLTLEKVHIWILAMVIAWESCSKQRQIWHRQKTNTYV